MSAKEYKDIERERKVRNGEKVNWSVPTVKWALWLLVIIEAGRTYVEHYEAINTYIGALV